MIGVPGDTRRSGPCFKHHMALPRAGIRWDWLKNRWESC
jgi:hypothetical protein